MEDIYYVDRPSVPPTQQVIIRLDSLLEHSVCIDSSDIAYDLFGSAVEVRDDNGDIKGVLAYFPGVTHAELISGEYLDEKEVLGDEGTDVGTPDGGVDHNITESDVQETVDALREERLLNLELELAAAKQQVQDIEDEIADEEGALD